MEKNVRPSLAFVDESDIDPLHKSIFEEAESINEKENAKEANSNSSSSSNSMDSSHEKGNHRSNDDGFRREIYLQLIYQCLEAAKPFENFNSRDCFYHAANVEGNEMSRKRRKIEMDESTMMRGDGSAKSTLLVLSKVMCALRASLEIERERIFA